MIHSIKFHVINRVKNYKMKARVEHWDFEFEKLDKFLCSTNYDLLELGLVTSYFLMQISQVKYIYDICNTS